MSIAGRSGIKAPILAEPAMFLIATFAEIFQS
jgi:hypothetical protein